MGPWPLKGNQTGSRPDIGRTRNVGYQMWRERVPDPLVLGVLGFIFLIVPWHFRLRQRGRWSLYLPSRRRRLILRVRIRWHLV
jgi:hypothetical protein